MFMFRPYGAMWEKLFYQIVVVRWHNLFSISLITWASFKHGLEGDKFSSMYQYTKINSCAIFLGEIIFFAYQTQKIWSVVREQALI